MLPIALNFYLSPTVDFSSVLKCKPMIGRSNYLLYIGKTVIQYITNQIE